MSYHLHSCNWGPRLKGQHIWQIDLILKWISVPNGFRSSTAEATCVQFLVLVINRPQTFATAWDGIREFLSLNSPICVLEFFVWERALNIGWTGLACSGQWAAGRILVTTCFSWKAVIALLWHWTGIPQMQTCWAPHISSYNLGSILIAFSS